MADITQKELRALFVYEEHGMLRKTRSCKKPYPWRKIGVNGRYLATTIGNQTYYLHRLIWLYHHGVMPLMIDHINGNTQDNRIENLRECTNAQNQYNSKRKVNNALGVKGVVYHWRCVRKPYQAKIVVNGKVISLGYHPTLELAAKAYAAGAEKFAKTFARTE